MTTGFLLNWGGGRSCFDKLGSLQAWKPRCKVTTISLSRSHSLLSFDLGSLMMMVMKFASHPPGQELKKDLPGQINLKMRPTLNSILLIHRDDLSGWPPSPTAECFGPSMGRD